MKIKVRYFAAVREASGVRENTLDLPAGETVKGLGERLLRTHPGLAPLLPSVCFAVGLEYASPERVLEEGDEVSLIPPVSGGCTRSRCVKGGRGG